MVGVNFSNWVPAPHAFKPSVHYQECINLIRQHYLIYTLGAPAYKAHDQFLRKKIM